MLWVLFSQYFSPYASHHLFEDGGVDLEVEVIVLRHDLPPDPSAQRLLYQKGHLLPSQVQHGCLLRQKLYWSILNDLDDDLNLSRLCRLLPGCPKAASLPKAPCETLHSLPSRVRGRLRFRSLPAEKSLYPSSMKHKIPSIWCHHICKLHIAQLTFEKRAESGGIGVFLRGESGGVQPKGGRGETQEPEEVEMDMISSLLSGLLSLVERLVLALVEGLEPLVESWA